MIVFESFLTTFKLSVFLEVAGAVVLIDIKALENWKIFLKALSLSKRLWKLTIKTKRLWRLKFLSFVKVND